MKYIKNTLLFLLKERLKVYKGLFLTKGYYLYLWKDKFFIIVSICFILMKIYNIVSYFFCISFLIFTFFVSLTNYIILNPDKYEISFGSGKNGNK